MFQGALIILAQQRHSFRKNYSRLFSDSLCNFQRLIAFSVNRDQRDISTPEARGLKIFNSPGANTLDILGHDFWSNLKCINSQVNKRGTKKTWKIMVEAKITCLFPACTLFFIWLFQWHPCWNSWNYFIEAKKPSLISDFLHFILSKVLLILNSIGNTVLLNRLISI